MLITFSELSADSRVWVFPLRTSMSAAAADQLVTGMEEFIRDWRAHDDPVTGAVQLLKDRFLIVAADSRGAAVSGCSIDSLTRQVKVLLSQHGLEADNGELIFYLSENEVRSATRSETKELIKSGSISGQTAVFDTSITNLAQFNSRFVLPFGDSWHGKVFK